MYKTDKIRSCSEQSHFPLRLIFQQWKAVLLGQMLEAGKEEKRLAEAAGDFCEDGCTPKITVVVDGGWSHRSHGHRYSANSGVAVIIGKRTKKLLYLGVRNKLCSTCAFYARKNVEAKKAHLLQELGSKLRSHGGRCPCWGIPAKQGDARSWVSHLYRRWGFVCIPPDSVKGWLRSFCSEARVCEPWGQVLHFPPLCHR